MLVVNKLGVAAEVRASSAGNSSHSVCGVEVFTQPALSWGKFEVSDVDEQWTKQPLIASHAGSAMVLPISIAVVQLCSETTLANDRLGGADGTGPSRH
jgi:hypothetical protein